MDLFNDFVKRLLLELTHPLFVIGQNQFTPLLLLYLAVFSGIVALSVLFVRRKFIDNFLNRYDLNQGLALKLVDILSFIAIAFGIVYVLDFSTLEITADEILSYVDHALSRSVFQLGKEQITWRSLFYMIILSVMLSVGSRRLQKVVIQQTQKRTDLDVGTVYSISVISRYFVLAIGFIIILQTAGIDLSSLTIMAGAVGLGLSVGLQSLTSNITSGLTILMERPIKVGDRVQVDDVIGDITKITFRATTILTNDNIEIIVPNSRFITEKVINWSLSSPTIRVRIPLGVSYNTEPDKLKKIIVAVASKHKGVLKEPGPDLIFLGYGDSSLDFELRVWTSEFTRQPSILKSDLYYEIFARLKKEGIEIPFPQRDLHIRSSVVQVGAGIKES